MPIEPFEGETFVAFTDISGFKRMMAQPGRAKEALESFYSVGWECLDRDNDRSECAVEGIFVSDCGVLFVRPNEKGRSECLCKLLTRIRALNKKLLGSGVLLRTSVAFGQFQYLERRSAPGIRKVPFYGEAYLAAFLDSESTRPKLNCGFCRIVKEGLPSEMDDDIDEAEGEIFSMIRRDPRSQLLYYYWMRNTPQEIDDFKKQYGNAEDLKFEGIRHILAGTIPQVRPS
jgi:hypothetical protein